MRALITGGAGFIGSHLVDRLVADGHDVVILDSLDPQVHDGLPEYMNRDAEYVDGDIRDRDLVRSCLARADRLVHFAAAVGVAQSMYEIERYMSVNVVGAAVVLEEATEARDHLEKVIVASSNTIYGEGLYRCPDEGIQVAPEPRSDEQLAARRWEVVCPTCGAALEPLPTPETKRLAPTSIYAIGKRDQEEMVLAWGSAYGVASTALRFFSVYGQRQSLSNPYTGVASIFASRLLNGNPPIVFEDGSQSRDFVHVSDIVSSVVTGLEPGRGDGMAINVGSGTRSTVLDVADVLAHGVGVEIEPEIRHTFRAADVRHCFADVTRARELLGFSASISFADGMRELAGWLEGREAVDRVEEATEALRARGLTA